MWAKIGEDIPVWFVLEPRGYFPGTLLPSVLSIISERRSLNNNLFILAAAGNSEWSGSRLAIGFTCTIMSI